MNVLSLFDGMSCGQIALRELGVHVDKYYASEIDKFAIKQTQTNFPDTIQLGDVNNWQSWDIHWSSIDLVLAGSPCQGFSFAGKGLAFDDPRSKLFFVFVEILEACKLFNPNVKFLLENVDMKKEHLRIISEYVGLFPTKINSTLVSAQNRERWYWTNIRTKKSGLFDEIHTDIPQPKDRKIFLRDILQPESEIDKKYYLSRTALARVSRKIGFIPKIEPDKTGTLNTKNNSGQLSIDAGTTLIHGVTNNKGSLVPQEKANCIDANYTKGMDNHSQHTMIITHNLQIRNGKGQGGKGHLQKEDQKSYCLDTTNNQGIEFPVCVAMRGRNPDNPSDRITGSPTEQRLEAKTDGKTNCLTNVQKDNLVFVGGLNEPNRGDGSLSRDYHQQDRVYDANLSNKAATVAATMNSKYLVKNPVLSEPTHKHGEERVYDEGKAPTIQARYGTGGDNVPYVNNLRRLTPIECSRLQTIPSWYKWVVSDSQIYRMLGNGWTVEVVKHILSFGFYEHKV